ncbi:MAG TPA: hypothetical protein DCZ03_02240 [Gammaproteobacteria bacterium]|nr:hypothetical protein [Gammaproteobacteria bacterium]
MPVPRDIAEEVLENILSENFVPLFLHLTMELVNKMMEMMQGPRPQIQISEFIEPLQLRKTKIKIKDMTVIYKTPPMTITTEWVYMDDNYRIRDLSYKPNWIWALLHYKTMKQVKEKMEAARAQAEADAQQAARLAEEKAQAKLKAQAAADAEQVTTSADSNS